MKPTSILCLVLLIFSCTMACKSKKSNRAEFEKFFEKNVAACMEVRMQQEGLDSATAHARCSCMLVIAYQLDSNLYNLSDDARRDLLRAHDKEIRACDSF